MDREKITLTGAPETMLATLYGRALDSRQPDSILHDDAAERALRRVDYDFAKTKITKSSAAGVAARAKVLDDWTAEFLAAHREATVLHLACGLDTRVQRLNPAKSVRWIDLDFPEVIDLRERLLDPLSGDYRMIGSSVTDLARVDDVPADRPTVAVFEGLTMYLHKEDGKRLIQRLTSRFPTGQLLFDCYGSLGIKLQKRIPAVRNSGATLHWGIDDAHELEAWHPGLTCLDALRSVDLGLDRMPATARLALRVMAHLPGFKDVGKILRYSF